MQTRQGPRLNHEIQAVTVRVIDDNGGMLGIMPLQQAFRTADAKGLDLVEINPTSVPPVVKLIDYGKFRYEQRKRQHDAKRKQHIVETKEIKLRPNIDTHDYEIKLAAMRRFLEGGDKVRITLRFRGREVTHSDLGFALLIRIQSDLAEVVRVEQAPRQDGKQIGMLMAPKAEVAKDIEPVREAVEIVEMQKVA